MSQWQKREMRSAGNKPVAHAKKLSYLWNLAQQREQPVQMGKVRGHKKETEEAQWNNSADEEAKEGANEGTLWQP